MDYAFEKVRKSFIASIDSRIWKSNAVPCINTLRDNFRSLMRDSGNKDASNAAASGISEDIYETQQVLDDLIREKESDDEEKSKREEVYEKEQKLLYYVK